MACMLEMGQSPSVDFPIAMVKTVVKQSAAHEPEERIPRVSTRCVQLVASIDAELGPTHTFLHASSVENNQSFVKNQNGNGEAPR